MDLILREDDTENLRATGITCHGVLLGNPNVFVHTSSHLENISISHPGEAASKSHPVIAPGLKFMISRL